MRRPDTYSVRLAPGLADRLRVIARAEGRSVTYLVGAAVWEWLERHRGGPPACTRCGQRIVDPAASCSAAFGGVPCSAPSET